MVQEGGRLVRMTQEEGRRLRMTRGKEEERKVRVTQEGGKTTTKDDKGYAIQKEEKVKMTQVGMRQEE